MLIFQLISWLKMPSKKERELSMEISALRQQQSQISMTDNFAAHAKLQRKINNIEMELKNVSDGRYTNNYEFQLGVTYGTKLIFGLILLCIAVYYRYTPVYVFPETITWYPLSSIISFPNEQAGAVSVHFWLIVSNAVARRLVN